jgi:hypothetical protein
MGSRWVASAFTGCCRLASAPNYLFPASAFFPAHMVPRPQVGDAVECDLPQAVSFAAELLHPGEEVRGILTGRAAWFLGTVLGQRGETEAPHRHPRRCGLFRALRTRVTCGRAVRPPRGPGLASVVVVAAAAASAFQPAWRR